MLWGLSDKIRITEAKIFWAFKFLCFEWKPVTMCIHVPSIGYMVWAVALSYGLSVSSVQIEFSLWVLNLYMYLLVSVDKWDYVKLWWTWIQIGNRRYSTRLLMLPFNSAFMLDILWCHFRAQIICSILLVQMSNDVTSWIPNSIVYYLLLTVFCALFIETFMLKH